ncbi:hypothetical protein PanWU01x14_047050 [Parasponia andersonii]|uniref:Uncharacterized protein n=1 Tax=Parasponia andersonii TaxID=3476 RepID=A0A2P5DNY2_PARAD|nr:hypothetical protein PanWU01x14_047050 [Parasponia andersonii]
MSESLTFGCKSVIVGRNRGRKKADQGGERSKLSLPQFHTLTASGLGLGFGSRCLRMRAVQP